LSKAKQQREIGTALPPGVAAVDPQASQIDRPTVEQMEALALHMAASLGQIAAILMQMPQHRNTLLTDLRWLVTPALISGQYVVVQAQDDSTGLSSPIAMAIWAQVSPEVDRRLSASPAKPLRLNTEDWNSGSIIWLVEAAGDNAAINALISGLVEHRFPTGIKSWMQGSDGPVLKTLTKSDFVEGGNNANV
jgi:hemolysin-activating ACP:hemolysin acyltransferase